MVSLLLSIIAVLNAVFQKAESASSNVKHFTSEFDADDVNNGAQGLVLMMLSLLSDEIITKSSFESIQTLYLL